MLSDAKRNSVTNSWSKHYSRLLIKTARKRERGAVVCIRVYGGNDMGIFYLFLMVYQCLVGFQVNSVRGDRSNRN
jgi:hypothetical protein